MELFLALTGDLKFRDAIRRAQDMEKRGETVKMRKIRSFLTEAMNDGITIGEERARKSIMENLIASGMSRQQAAAFTGVTGANAERPPLMEV